MALGHQSQLKSTIFQFNSSMTFHGVRFCRSTGLRSQISEVKLIRRRILKDVTSRRVWETWKADYEAFQPGGTPPTEWTSFDAVTPCIDIPFSNGGKPRLLAAFSKFSNLAEADFGAPGNPLVGQNHTYTRYEVRVNRAEYDFIRDHKLYLRETLKKLKEPLRFSAGAIQVKAAWRD